MGTKSWYYNSLVDYTKYVHVPNETPIIQRFDYLYNSLVEYFNGKNVTVILWKVNEHLRDNITGGAKYPIISDEYSDINDSHWSWEGHTQFYEFIIK